MDDALVQVVLDIGGVRTTAGRCRRRLRSLCSLFRRQRRATVQCVSFADATGISESKPRIKALGMALRDALAETGRCSARRDRALEISEHDHMLTRRVIVCLDVKGGRVVKACSSRDSARLAIPLRSRTYEREGADEITFLDISASAEERATLLDVARRTRGALVRPLRLAAAFAPPMMWREHCALVRDKVSLNSARCLVPRS
jgi:hypothetical protein